MYQSLMLAQLLGLFFTVMGIGMIFNREHMRKVLLAVADNHAIQFVASIIPLLLGGYIVITHNCWVMGWPVIITVLGWIILVAGAFRAIFPAFWVARIRHASQRLPVAFIGTILLILGVVLLYLGLVIIY